MRIFKKIGKIALVALAAILMVVICYVLYVVLSYSRIEDNVVLDIDRGATESELKIDTEYVAVTQNLGFGAYTSDFTFFMDGGDRSRAESRESVIACIEKGIETVSICDPDIILFQEIDLDATRSYHTDQYAMLRESLKGYSSACAQNYDSAYLFWPLYSPHGASSSSLTTFSRFEISSSLRRSLPISESFSKFLDLDRCYSVTRITVEGGRELVVYNAHTSAYGSSDEIISAQMTMLLEDMEREYRKGNYVICGGDFNQDFTGDSVPTLNGREADFGWAQPFPKHLIPEGFSRCIDYKDGALKPTCRNCDIPYKEGNFVLVVDGFIVSDNVECVEVENVQTGFEYSDHNPVVMTFKLIDDK